MLSRTAIAFAATLVLGALGPPAWAAACAQACKDEVAACRSAECAQLTGKAGRHCRRGCKKGLVQDCLLDLSVCGATTARPKPARPPGGGSSGGGW